MKVFAILILTLVSFPVFSKSGDEVRNGGGLAENYLVYALNNLEQSIDLCLIQKECGKRNEGRAILSLIKSSLAEEKKNDVLKFSSSAERPGFFVINGVVRLAVTGSHVGAPIYYNLDLLYKNDEITMSHGQAVQSLIHELGHHHGVTNHDQLELLGAEVRSAVEGNISEVSFLPHLGKNSIIAMGMKSSSIDKPGLLVVSFKDQLVDLTSLFNFKENACEGDKQLNDNFEVRGIHFFNLNWEHEPRSQGSKGQILKGNLSINCQSTNGFVLLKYYDFSIEITVKNRAQAFEYVDKKLLPHFPRYIFKTYIFPR